MGGITEQQEDFYEWLTNYLYTNTGARRAIMNNPTKTKKACKQEASWFIFDYGWKVKEK